MRPLIPLLLLATAALAQTRAPHELTWALRYDPKTLDPAKVDDESSETLRFLTAGVLLRVNRLTQQVEPQLAAAWQESPDGRTITFTLRPNLQFSNGAPLTSADAAASLRRLLDPATAAPTAEEFLAPTQITIDTPDPLHLRLHLARRVINIARIFDEIAIEPATPAPHDASITAGPFTLTEFKRGQYLRLTRNPHYFKRDLPYAPSLRLDIVANREQEIAQFRRGAYDFIDKLPPEYFATLAEKSPATVKDFGPSLNTEQLWFNQSPAAPLPAHEKAWFASQPFRLAISQAIHRADLARIAYAGHATPAYDFISPANTPWHNAALKPPPEDLPAARHLLAAAGFHLTANLLYDPTNHPVRFSILTNSGNTARHAMATLIQQDLLALGIEVTVVTLDFPALIERLMHTQDYQACLLGLTNVDPDPNAMMNLWLSSSPNHQWNPSEKSPATPWEAEIDTLMSTQASALSQPARKRALDRVQQIVADQQPFIYLVYPNRLYAISPRLQGVQPAALQPALIWNIESLRRQPN